MESIPGTLSFAPAIAPAPRASSKSPAPHSFPACGPTVHGSCRPLNGYRQSLHLKEQWLPWARTSQALAEFRSHIEILAVVHHGATQMGNRE